MNRSLLLAALLGLISAVGCDDGGPDPVLPPPANLTVDGSYAIVSTFDLTIGAVLPEPVASYTATLVDLRRDPASTLFVVLDQAGVPLAHDLVDALPDVVAGQVKGWMNAFFAADTYGGSSVGAQLDALADVIETVVARPDIASRLTLPALDAAGITRATHTLEELRYRLYGGALAIAVPLREPPAFAATLLVRETTLDARATAPRNDEDARLYTHDHTFGIPYGPFALDAIEQAARQRYATDLRGLLGLLVDCNGMAASVASRCVLGACVGHQDGLRALCDRGVDLIQDQLRGRIAALAFDALRLQSGEAALWDAPAADGARDNRIDSVSAGKWAAQIDFGMGPHDVHATFAGARTP
jgi:hypothetical protein